MSKPNSAEYRALQQQKLALQEELLARECLKDCHVWLTRGTKTLDEQDPTGENPMKPFPMFSYIPHVLQAFENERTVFLPKSRTMMATWTVCGWAAYKMFQRPATCVVFQSEDEKRALDCVKYVKILWSNSLESLRKRWPLMGDTVMADHAKNELKMANHSRCIGLVGKPDKIRSEHPTIYVADEAAFMTRFNDSFSAARGARPLHVICISSAAPGDFEDIVSTAKPCDWPDWTKKEEAA